MVALFPKIIDQAIKKDIDHLTWLVREYFAPEGGRTGFLDIDGVIQNFGILFSEKMISPYLGILIMDDQKGKLHLQMQITKDHMSKNHSNLFEENQERRFIKAHILGHFFLHLQPMIISGTFQPFHYQELVSPLTRYMSFQQDREEESQADNFAAALLMPRSMVLRGMSVLNDTEKLAKIFGVTENLMKARIKSLSISKEQTIKTASQEKSPKEEQTPHQPFKRLRMLAKQIDKTVNI